MGYKQPIPWYTLFPYGEQELWQGAKRLASQYFPQVSYTPYRQSPKRKAPPYDAIWKTIKRLKQNQQTKQPLSFTKTETDEQDMAPYNGTTREHDASVQYRYRRMPRRMRNRHIRFARRVSSAAESLLGLRTVVLNDQIIADNGGNATGLRGVQGWCFAPLYGAEGQNLVNENGNADLFEIKANDTEISDASLIHFYGATLDLTCTWKQGATVAPVGELPGINNDGPDICFVDVYEVVFNRNDNEYASMAAVLAANDTAATLGSTALQISQRGVTLFDLNQAIAASNMKILKKTRYEVSSGENFSLHKRLNKHYWVNGEDINVADVDMNHAGMTRGFFLLTRSQYVSTSGRLTVDTTRTYKYKVQASEVATRSGGYM